MQSFVAGLHTGVVLGQSTLPQQAPEKQLPAQQMSPVPHACVTSHATQPEVPGSHTNTPLAAVAVPHKPLPRHALHTCALQIPEAQPASAQHSCPSAAGVLPTCAHPPSEQQVRAPPQCESLVHLPQLSVLTSHARASGSLAPEQAVVSLGQQPLSAMQIGPSTLSAQQVLPLPQSLAARLQLAQLWLRQVFCEAQSLALQHVPLVHEPPQQTWPALQVCVSSHATQALLAHS